jgi:hypothetical protein
MVVGSEREPVLQVQWARPRRRGFHPRAWINRQVKDLAAPAATRAPRPEGFDETAYLPEVASRGGGGRAVWMGFSRRAGLAVEVGVNLGAEAKARRLVTGKLLNGVEVSEKAGATPWAFFDVSFISPPGYTLEDWKLYAGDMVMRLGRGREARLLMRQVYPADTALGRRPLERWLNSWPFKEHRRFVSNVGSSSGVADWRADLPAGTCEGRRREGWKRLAWPMHRAGARCSLGAGVVDSRLNRLLLAELDGVPGTRGDDALLGVLRDMNWARYARRSAT